MASGSRKTHNSQKTANMNTEALNQAFLTPGKTVIENMGSMQDILNGKFLNEAFENMSTDEKLSLILTELYKLRDNMPYKNHPV